MASCKKCGEEMNVSSNKCPKCGTRVLGKRAATITLWGVIAIGLFAWLSAGDDESSVTEVARPTPVQQSPSNTAPAEPSPLEQFMAIEDLDSALMFAKLDMADTVNEYSAGAAAFALWSARHLTWEALNSVPATKLKMAMKDSDEVRGKRICVRGEIVEIQAEKTDDGKIYNGAMATRNFDFVRFSAAGTTGELVEDSRARFCGIFTGLFSYSNVSGGQTRSIFLVGMFDLPENRRSAKLAKAD